MSSSQPQRPEPDLGPMIALSTSRGSEASGSGVGHLIPDDTADDEPNFTGTENPITLRDLFDFNSDRWVDLYDGFARNLLTEELALCELLNTDAATGEGAEVDVDEMTGEILTA
jgi:hypothetical protein